MGLFKKIGNALKKTREAFARRIDSLLSHGEIDDDFYDELTDILISCDIGVRTSMDIVENLRIRARKNKIRNADDVKKELLNSSIYLMSSRFEGLPMVLLEAQACGLPIVSFDCPEGPRNVISDKKNGFLIKCFDVESFSLNVGKLAKNNDQRIKMGTCAKYSSNRYSPSSISYEWDQLFAVVDIEL